MLPERFINAWAQHAHVVLGRRLRPLSLWHRFVLEILQSPFLSQTGKPGVADLMVAVRVCTARCPAEEDCTDLRRFLGLDHLRKEGFWGRLRWSLWSRKFRFGDEGEKLGRYLHEALSCLPEFWEDSKADAQTKGGPPDVLAVAAQLINGGFSRDDAWNMPFGKAYWYAGTLARINGANVEFVSETKEFFEGIQRLIDLNKAGKLKFHAKGIEYTP